MFYELDDMLSTYGPARPSDSDRGWNSNDYHGGREHRSVFVCQELQTESEDKSSSVIDDMKGTSSCRARLYRTRSIPGPVHVPVPCTPHFTTFIFLQKSITNSI